MFVRSIFDDITILFRYLRANVKIIFVTSLGLIISLSIISSANIFVDTERGTIISYYTERGNFYWAFYSNGDTNSNQPSQDQLKQILNSSLQKYDLLSKVDAIGSVIRLDSQIEVNISNSDPYTYYGTQFIQIENLDTFFSLFGSDAFLQNNTSNNQTALFLEIGQKPEYVNNITVGNQYELYIRNEKTVDLPNVTITGSKFFTYNEMSKYIDLIPEMRYIYGSRVLIFQNLTIFMDEIDNQIESQTNETDPFYYYKSLQSNIIYLSDASHFDGFDVGPTLTNLELLRLDIQNELGYDQEYYYYNVWLEDGVYQSLNGIVNSINLLLIILLLFSAPVFIIALFLAYYSFGLIKRQKYQQFGVVLTRGMNRLQLTLILLSEVVLSLVISVFAGVLLSIPFSSITVQSTGFFEFNNARSPVILWIQLIQFIANIGIVLIIITNLISVIRTSNISLADIEKHILKEQIEPFWKRKYLDIIFLILGVVSIWLVTEINNLPDQLRYSFAFLNFIIIPAPIFLVIGSILFISRIFSFTTSKISFFFWKKRSGLLSFSLKNVVRHKQASVRAILLIAINTAFIIAFITFPYANIAYQEEKTIYDIGADLYVDFIDNTQFDNFSYYSSVFVNVSDKIDSYSLIISASLRGNNILAINTSDFLDTAYFKESYTPNIETKIKNLGTNMSILLLKDNFNVLDKKINESFTWPSSYGSSPPPEEGIPSYNFKIAGTYNLFPNFDTYYLYNPRQQFYGIMSLETFNFVNKMTENISEMFEWEFGLTNIEFGLYVKPILGVNTTILANDIKNSTIVNYVEDYDSIYYSAVNNPSNSILFSLINSNILFLLMISIFVLVMFGFLQIIERGKEVATERALGMTVKQTFLLFIYETNWLLLFGLVTGIILGIFVSSMFMLPFITSSVPPLTMVYPLEIISPLILVILIGSIIFNFFPAYLSSKIEVTKLLKVE